MSQEYLVSFDTDRIKDYVFATDKLREVRGASLLLEKLNDENEMKQLITSASPSAELVYAAGGSSAVIAPSEPEANSIITLVEETYRRETVIGSITGVSIPLSPATREQGFGHRMEIAALRLRERKDEKANRRWSALESYVQPCAACGCLPASVERDGQAICLSCQQKRKVFDEDRRQHPERPKDLGKVGEKSRPPDYVGFIFVDGNNMGDSLHGLESTAQYQMFSLDLDKLIKKIVKETLQKHNRRESKQTYDTLLMGGDDVMAVTTGDMALPVALEVAKRFDAESPDILRRVGVPDIERLTLGVGVVIAHTSFPIVAFHRLARQLLKRAKQCCAENSYQQSALDFMVVTAAGSNDLKDLRQKALSEQTFAFPHTNLRAHLTERPYLVRDAEKLWAHAQQFKQARFPSSQLNFLYEGLFHSLGEAVYRWRKVAGRAKKDHSELMEKFHQAFSAENTLPPWRGQYNAAAQREYVTAFGDLVEIYRFVPNSSQEKTHAPSQD